MDGSGSFDIPGKSVSALDPAIFSFGASDRAVSTSAVPSTARRDAEESSALNARKKAPVGSRRRNRTAEFGEALAQLW